MTFIKNVKISTKFLSDQPLAHFSDIAINRNVDFTHVRNILVIKDIFPITVFKQEKNRYHLNVTGIKTLNGIEEAILWLEDTYCNKTDFQLNSYNIDNITSTFDVKHRVPLHTLATVVKHSSYNPERFHALYFKSDEGTAVVFQTGKINIVGSKSVKSILSLWTFIKKKIDVACMRETF